MSRARRLLAGGTVALFGAALLVVPASAQEVPTGISNAQLDAYVPTFDDVGPDNETTAGVGSIDVDDVDVAALPFLSDQPESAPLRSSPLRSSPLRSSPLRSSPLRSSPLRSSPLRSSPLRSSPLRSSPLRSSALPAMTLAEVPLLIDGGWERFLALDVAAATDADYPDGGNPTVYAGLPLQAVTLQQVLALDPAAHPQVGTLTLEHVSLDSTPLRSSSIQAFLFAGPTLNELSTSFCTQLDCAALGLDPAVHTLLEAELAGATAQQLAFVGDLPVADADLSQAIVADYDVLSVNVSLTPLGGLTVSQLPPGIVDCTAIDCTSDPTLAEAVDVAAILDAPTAVLRPLLEPEFVGDLTFAGLLRALVDPSRLSFQDVPLDALLGAAPIDPEARNATYEASADIQCGAESVVFSVVLPRTFAFVADSTFDPTPVILSGEARVAAVAEAESTFPALSVGDDGRQRLDFAFGGVACAPEETVRHLDVGFRARPGVVLGAQTASFAVIRDDASVALPHTAPIVVTEVFEPNGDCTEESCSKPSLITDGQVLLSHVGSSGDVDNFQIVDAEGGTFARGTIITAVLSHIPDGVDYDLVLDGVSSAPLRSSPLRSSPLRSSPIEDNGHVDDGGAETVPGDTLADIPLRSSPLRSSANRGQAAEVVTTMVTGERPLTLRVIGANGDHGAYPYTLQVLVQPPPELNCTTPRVLGSGGPPQAVPALPAVDPATQTLLLFNTTRFAQAYGPQAAADVLAGLNGLAAHQAVNGAVLSVDADPAVAAAYAAWDAAPCEPEAANDVVRAINDLVTPYVTDELRFVTIVGDDDVVPFARVPDLTVLSNQVDYYPNVTFDGTDNPISAAYGYGYVLTDNAYGELDQVDWLDHQLLLPDLATGRVVETPGEILGAIAQFNAQPYIDVGEAVTTGYDFLADLEQQVSDAFGGADARLNTEDWTRDDLVAALGAGPDVASVNAHFDHSNALPAIGNAAPSPSAELFSSGDLLGAAALPVGAFAFSVGCQSGLNVADRNASVAEQTLDFAQVMARNAAGGYVANTGFGYGDTVAVAYSERLAELFAERLDGSMTVGQALVAARTVYFNELPLPGVYDDKAMIELTAYGFPFVRVGQSGGVAPRSDGLVRGESGLVPGSDTVAGTGLPVATFDVNPALAPTQTERGTFYRVGGFQPLLSHYRPIQPSMTEPLPQSPDPATVGDVLITGLTSTDVPLDDPVHVRPTSDDSSFEPELVVDDVAFPATLATITTGGQLALLPGQYRSDLANPQRLYTGVRGQVFYAAPNSTIESRPSIPVVDAVDLGDTVAIRAEIDDAEFALALYLPADGDTWGSVELHDAGGGTWTGGIVGVEVRELFVQAVNDGWVGVARGKGVDYLPEPPAEAAPGVTVTVDATPGDNGWFVSDASVQISASEPGLLIEASLDGAAFAPVTAPIPVSGDGLHFVDYRTSTGGQSTVVVPIDTTDPVVEILSPAPGEVVGAGFEPSFTCSDATSGVVCTSSDVPLDQPGHRRLTVTATDGAGNEATASVDYIHEFDFEGFFPPIANDGVFNAVNAGQSVPAKWRLRDADGELVGDVAVVAGVTSTTVACPSQAPSASGPAETTSGAENGLRYDQGDEQYVFTWQTERAWKGTCRRLDVALVDGQVFSALFDFRR